MALTPGIHPRDACRPTDSHAEQAVWSALRAGMPSGWYGWHSLRVRDRNGFQGEGDFVLAHPQRGLLVLEVKGGRLEQGDGRWLQNGTAMDEAPLDQGNRFVRKLVQRLRDDDFVPPAFGAAVCFPDTAFDRQPSQDDLAGLVLGRGDLPYLKEALPPVIERAVPLPGHSRGQWIEALHRLWGETWVPALSLGVRAQEAAERRLGLDAAQVAALEGLLENERVLVEGGAGSGKTSLAAEAAQRIAAQGQKVLLLCFTVPLAHWLSQRLATTGVEVNTISGFAKKIVDAAGTPPTAADVTSSEFWRAVYQRAEELCGPAWDAVIVDEAQDLEFDAWYLVSTLASGRRLWAFFDPGQGFWPDRTPPRDLFKTFFKLPRQQRSPPGIQAFANRLLGVAHDAAAIVAAQADGTLVLVTAPSPSAVPDKVGEEVDRLLSRGLAPGQIGIVSLRGQTAADAIHHLPRVGRHEVVPASHPEMESRLVADSFLRWKGLERPAIIVTDLPDGELSRLPIRLNVALSRATLVARVVATAPALARTGAA